MRNDTQTLYAILGVAADAKAPDIERAYRRIVAEMQQETTPPDARRRVRVEHAHDVLMDPVRREAYDIEQRSPQMQIERARRSRRTMAALVALVVVAAGATWFTLRSDNAPARPAKSLQEIQTAVAPAVGRLYQVELSGQTAPLGLAFAIDEGIMVSSCEGVTPNSEMFVKFGKRQAPVRVSAVDEASGLCKLTGATVGSWPLGLARFDPAPAERAYVVSVGPAAEAQLQETHVRKLAQAAGRRAFEIDTPVGPQSLGGPLLDVEARVVGAAARVNGRALHVQVPQTWLAERFVKQAPPPPPPEEKAAGADKEPKGEREAPELRNPANISPERKERLEKAFRPPPTVPDDI